MKLTYTHTKYTCYLSYIVSALINNYAPLLFITFQKSFGISTEQIGILVTANFTTQMLVDFLGANFIDKIGYRTSMAAANFLAALGLVFMVVLTEIMSAKYTALIISTVIYAVGSGLLEVLVSPIIQSIPTKSKNSAMSMLHSFYCWGCVIVIGISSLFFRTVGIEFWRILTLLWATVPFIVMIMFLFVPVSTLSDENKNSTVKSMFSSKLFWLFFVLMISSGASEQAISQWASLFSESALKVSKTVGDLLGPCMFAVLMGSARSLYAIFGSKWNLKRLLTMCSVLCIASYLVTALCPNSMISLAGCAICGFAVGIAWPGVLSLASHEIGYAGTAMFGILALGGDIGCFSGPETVALGSSFFSIFGSPIRAGILLAAVFPVIMLIGITVLNFIKAKNAKAIR